jgi:hypothetical protein
MTTQTFPAGTIADATATTTRSPSTAPPRRSRRVRAAVATAVVSAMALLALGVTWQSRADDASTVVPQRASETSLRLAAESARRMEVLAPEIYRASPRPASYIDLRLAAEWARRLETLGTS